MADERQLRDELEKVQSAVLKLRTALGKPETLHADFRARIEQLRRSRDQQRARLEESLREEERLSSELGALTAQNAKLNDALDAAQRSERVLVAQTVSELDPGPARAGCLGLVLVFLFGASP